MEQTSYLQKDFQTLVQDFQQLGGGINIDIVQTDLIGYYDHQQNEQISIGVKNESIDKYIILNSTRQQYQYEYIFNNRNQIQQHLTNDKYIQNWLFQGYNICYLTCGDSTNIFKLALDILQQSNDYIIRVSGILLKPKIEDNFQTETMHDMFGDNEIYKISQSTLLDINLAISSIKQINKSKKMTQPSKFQSLNTEIIKIFLSRDNIHFNTVTLIQFYEDLFQKETQQTNYEKRTQKQIEELQEACIRCDYTTKEKLCHMITKRSILVEFLIKNVFDNCKIVVCNDLSQLKKNNKKLKLRLDGMDKFRKIKAICSRYSVLLEDPVRIITKNTVNAPFEMKRAISPINNQSHTMSIHTFKSNLSPNQNQNNMFNQSPKQEFNCSQQQDIQEKDETGSLLKQMKYLMTQIESPQEKQQEKTLKRNTSYQNKENRKQLIELEDQRFLSPKSQHSNYSQQLNQLMNNKITQLNYDITLDKQKYESQQIELIDKIQILEQRLRLLGKDMNLEDLVGTYEQQISVLETQVKNLRDQQEYLSRTKKGDQSSDLKLKEFINKMSVDFSEKEQELAYLKRQLREYAKNQFFDKYYKEKNQYLLKENGILKEKNDELLNNIQKLNFIIEKQKNDLLDQKKKIVALHRKNDYVEENLQLVQQINYLSGIKDSKREEGIFQSSSNKRIQIFYETKDTNFNSANENFLEQINESFEKLRSLQGDSQQIQYEIQSIQERVNQEWRILDTQVTSMKVKEKLVNNHLVELQQRMESSLGKNDETVKFSGQFIMKHIMQSLNKLQ